MTFNPETAPHAKYYVRPFEVAAPLLAVKPSTVPVRSVTDIERAIFDLGRAPVSGLIVLPDTFTVVHRRVIISAAASSHVPAIYPFRFMAGDGNLISLALISSTCTAAQRPTLTASSKAASLPNYRCSSRAGSSCSSISRPPRRSASNCRRRSLRAPTR